MPSHRRANYIEMTPDRMNLDFLKAKYHDIRFAIPAIKEVTVNDAFEGNLPGIAYKLWGDPDFGYWWVLGLFNGIIDPLDDVPTGTILRVPNIDDVKKYLQSIPEDGLAQATNVVEL